MPATFLLVVMRDGTEVSSHGGDLIQKRSGKAPDGCTNSDGWWTSRMDMPVAHDDPWFRSSNYCRQDDVHEGDTDGTLLGAWTTFQQLTDLDVGPGRVPVLP